jgi:flagellar basal body-associated protein FliL
MAEEEEKASDAKDAPSGKSSKGLVVVVLLAAVVLGGGAAAAGAVVAMKVAVPAAAPAPAASEEKVLGTVDFASIVVDIHGQDGQSHHLRVSLAAEIPAEIVKDEVQNLTPRGREVAIGYLRSLTYEDATQAGSFEKIKMELSKRIIEAVGEKRIGAVIITDFVVQ